MHYYQFNIADYQSHTRHLSLIEDICYRRMLDWHYLHEKPLPLEIDRVARLLLLNECLTDVERVLNEFFTQTENGWINVRAMSEIDEYKEKIEKASAAGKASAAKRKDKIKQTFNDRSTTVQPNIKQEPLTNNHKTHAGQIALAIKNEGIIDINPSNPTFLALVEAGANIEEFSNAAKIAKSKGKGFNYIVAMVKGQREDAANLKLHKGDMPKKQDNSWMNDDVALMKKAKELSIHTSGKTKYEIIAKVQHKLATL